MNAHFEEFPKVMSHPGARPATLGYEFGEGKPCTFPPVSVNNEDQQAYYESKGYVAQGGSKDLSAHMPTNHVHQEYPKWVNGVIVQGPEHEKQLFPESVAEASTQPPKKRGRPRKSA